MQKLSNVFSSGLDNIGFDKSVHNFDVTTTQCIADYLALRGQISGAASVSGDAKKSVTEFIRLTDIVGNVVTLPNNINATYTPAPKMVNNNPSSPYALPGASQRASIPVNELQRRANSSIEAAQQMSSNSIALARVLIPAIVNDAYLAVKSPSPVVFTDEVSGKINEYKQLFMQALLAAKDRQSEAERWAIAYVGTPDLVGAWVLLGGDFDSQLVTLGINLPSLHKVYAKQLQAAGQVPQQQRFLDMVEADAFNRLISLAENLAARIVQIAQAETLKMFA